MDKYAFEARDPQWLQICKFNYPKPHVDYLLTYHRTNPAFQTITATFDRIRLPAQIVNATDSLCAHFDSLLREK